MYQYTLLYLIGWKQEAIYNTDMESVPQRFKVGRLLCWFIADSIFFDADSTITTAGFWKKKWKHECGFLQNRELTEDNNVHWHSICIEMKSISAHCELKHVCVCVWKVWVEV